ncbi:hypothetical protein D7U98_05550 [Stenotrophomonas maltophilia]|uniref:hypothetical protein n=1 Tax=Stenotrophomonas maltophilia TaxID=40324 RepID=UPI001311415C|nr:hypothetical protein [Stenotrophomonas maltophilia]MBA0394869.1 hypothetical protein [Stenotrophomonas maltophilia]
MYQLTSDPTVVYCPERQSWISEGTWLWDQYQLWLKEGNTAMPIGPAYTPYSPEHFRAIRDQAFSWMRGEAVARGYDSIESCASYYNSGVERYRLEARAMVAWRDAVNQRLEELVLAPPAGIETWEQVKPLLPQPTGFNWPSEIELPLGVGDGPAVQL